MPRLPTPTDLPPNLTYTLHPAPSSSNPTNILILLHGLGDTHHPLSTLSQTLSLPETATLSLRAPFELPLGIPGYHWSDEIVFSEAGELAVDGGFEKGAMELVNGVVDALVESCGWKRREVFFFGFGQGGMVALGYVLKEAEVEFGGVVSIGGGFPASSSASSSTTTTSSSQAHQNKQKTKTPILLIGAEKESAVTEEEENRARALAEDLKVVRWKGRVGDGEIRSEEEGRGVLEFFARRGRSVVGSRGEGVVEVL